MIFAKRLIPVGLAATLLAASLAGCTNSNIGTKQGVGAVIGGVGGAVAGAQFGKGKGQLAATAAGTLLGAWLGSEVGRSLDDADRMAMQQAQQKAYQAPMQESINWSNPNSGNSGTITPVREGTSTSGRYCREYQTTVNIGGQNERAYGTACRQPDGSWQVVQ